MRDPLDADPSNRGSQPPLASGTQAASDKQANFEDALQNVSEKAATGQVTSQDASRLESRESRLLGGTRPPSESVSAEAKRLASAGGNGGQANTNTRGLATGAQGAGGVSNNAQSQTDRDTKYQEAIEEVVPKMKGEPDNVTQEE